MDRFASLARAAWRHPRLAVLFLGAVGVAVMLGLRVTFAPAVAPAAVQGWMTPGYVARAYGIDRDPLAALLGAEPGSLRGRTIAEIAGATGRPEAELIAAIEVLRAGASE
jgi:hypothetical protein